MVTTPIFIQRRIIWQILILVFAILITWPFIALVQLSIGSSSDLWTHLFETVLFTYISNTLILMLGVACLSGIIGVWSAWILYKYGMPGKKVLEVMILLPAACPGYLVAYAYTDFFEYAGPFQGVLRDVMGWESASDYFFPEIRSIFGGTLVLSFVLYPYVYLLARTGFLNVSDKLTSVAKIYNKSEFWSVCLPLSRPAIMVGLSLVCMEVVSDFGTVEYFSLPTLTLGIFNVWIGMNDIATAAQISIFTFVFILLLLYLEFKSRGQRSFSTVRTIENRHIVRRVQGRKLMLNYLIVLIPIFLGFVLPVTILCSNMLKSVTSESFLFSLIVSWNTFSVAGAASIMIMLMATLFGTLNHLIRNKNISIITSIASMGYAFPGTMLAIGVIIFIGQIENSFMNILSLFSVETSKIYLSGTLGVLLFAYLVRYLAVGYGSIVSGLQNIPNNLNFASQTLGSSMENTIKRITLPLLSRFIFAGSILVFVDVVKELPMTLLLRPFNFETLATYTYQFAHDELMEQASMPALIIILVSMVPIIFLNKLLVKTN